MPGHAAEILDAVGHVPKFSLAMGEGREWVRAVNGRLGGANASHRIELAGPGDAAAPPLFARVRGGAIAVAIEDSASYRDEVPEVRALALSRRDPAGERKSGFHTVMVAAHRPHGLRYLGRIRYAPFYVWTRRNIAQVSELKGMKIRAGSQHGAFLRGLGMSPVEMSAKNIYMALRMGKIDGFGWISLGPRARGWLRGVRHRIDVPLYRAENVVSVMNLARWNRLKSTQRKAIVAATARFETGMAVRMAKRIRAEEAALTRYGIRRIRFSRQENWRYRSAALKAAWAALGRAIPKEKLDRLRKLSGS